MDHPDLSQIGLALWRLAVAALGQLSVERLLVQ